MMILLIPLPVPLLQSAKSCVCERGGYMDGMGKWINMKRSERERVRKREGGEGGGKRR
jgi:hypothetical protein